jgi:hypothetical protein
LTLIDEMLSKPKLGIFAIIYRVYARKQLTTTDDQHQTMGHPPHALAEIQIL